MLLTMRAYKELKGWAKTDNDTLSDEMLAAYQRHVGLLNIGVNSGALNCSFEDMQGELLLVSGSHFKVRRAGKPVEWTGAKLWRRAKLAMAEMRNRLHFAYACG